MTDDLNCRCRRSVVPPRDLREAAPASLFIVLGVLIALSAVVPPSPAQEPEHADVPAVQVAEGSAAPQPADDSADEQRRQTLASILLILLAGVCIMGVAMIAATMMWGAKLRRLARMPRPGPTKQDELWYLKKPSPPEEGPPAGERTSDHPSPPPAADGETTA